MTRADGSDPAGTVYLEFQVLGGAMRVTAIDAATGTEVTAVAPAGTARADLERLALGKLRRRLAGPSAEKPAAPVSARDTRSRTV